MPIDKKALKKLSKELPYGSSVKIRNRIIAKFGEERTYTTAYIRAVLSPDDPRKNDLIVDEAILLRDEILALRRHLESRIYQN
jgi:hypothetical protein